MKLFLLTLVSLLVFVGSSAQNTIDLNSLPAVEDLILVKTNPTADTVLVAIHGGPTDVLEPGDFFNLEVVPTFSVVEVKQYTHLYPNGLYDPSITVAQTIPMHDTTVAIIRKVINHYVDLNKTVVLIGHSLGGFLVQEYLDDYGVDELHRVIPMATRLNINQELVDSASVGGLMYFAGGLTLTSVQSDPIYWPTLQFLAGIGYNRYVDSLEGLDLSKLMFVSGVVDETVGRLLPNEVNFLQSNNATVLEIPGGDHDTPLLNPAMSQVIEFIRGTISVGIDPVRLKSDLVEIYPTLADTYLNANVSSREQVHLKLVTMDGRPVYQTNLTPGDHILDIAPLNPGNYIALFRSASGKTAVQRFSICR